MACYEVKFMHQGKMHVEPVRFDGTIQYVKTASGAGSHFDLDTAVTSSRIPEYFAWTVLMQRAFIHAYAIVGARGMFNHLEILVYNPWAKDGKGTQNDGNSDRLIWLI